MIRAVFSVNALKFNVDSSKTKSSEEFSDEVRDKRKLLNRILL